MKEKNFAFEKAENIAKGSAKQDFYESEIYADAEKNKIKADRKSGHVDEKKEGNDNRKKSGRGKNGGFITAIISLSVALVAVASALAFSIFMPQSNNDALEAGYRKSFYEAMTQVDNMDLNLSKALATKDGGAVQTYLVDIAVNSELAENNLQQLPIEDQNKFYTTKIINQVGDFAKYLNKKLINGEALSASDRENLKALYNANAALKNALQTAVKDMDGDYNFADIGKNFKGNTLIDKFNELQELSVEFPELIYDGPFSDGRDQREIKGLSGNEITSSEAEDVFKQIFAEYSPKNVKTENKNVANIETYGVSADINGDTAYAQISVTGGKLIMYAFAGSCNSINYDGDYATQKALSFVSRFANDMKAVWINLSNNVYTINFAPEINGTVIYPDLIKVRVCAETAMIIGLEATEYYSNHTERDIPLPALSKAEARVNVAEEIEVDYARLALVPTGQNAEKLCYEFYGTLNGDNYFVYIDAITGKQVELFKVINSEQGSLLM